MAKDDDKGRYHLFFIMIVNIHGVLCVVRPPGLAHPIVPTALEAGSVLQYFCILKDKELEAKYFCFPITGQGAESRDSNSFLVQNLP